MAEAYWDLEWELQQQGFDFCYDKRLYDRLEHGPGRERPAAPLRRPRLPGEAGPLHREPRRAAGRGDLLPARRRGPPPSPSPRCPGRKLLHEGQFEGRKVRLPVFLGRRPDEPADDELEAFYRRLLQAVRDAGVPRTAQWRLCDARAGPTTRATATWSPGAGGTTSAGPGRRQPFRRRRPRRASASRGTTSGAGTGG